MLDPRLRVISAKNRSTMFNQDEAVGVSASMAGIPLLYSCHSPSGRILPYSNGIED
jgi:hypothetical protein